MTRLCVYVFCGHSCTYLYFSPTFAPAAASPRAPPPLRPAPGFTMLRTGVSYLRKLQILFGKLNVLLSFGKCEEGGKTAVSVAAGGPAGNHLPQRH